MLDQQHLQALIDQITPEEREEIGRRIRTMNADLEYLDSIYAELAREHPGEWIAIHKGVVLGIAPTSTALAEQVRRVGLDPGVVLMQMIFPPDTILVV